jgi:uncharacterized protein
MAADLPIFDAHARVDGVPAVDLENLAYFGVEALVSCAHDGFAGERAEDLAAHFDALVRTVARVKAAGIKGHAAVGIPPSKIPWHGLEALFARLPEWLGLPEVVAVGAVGLFEGGEREEDVLRRQIDLARQVRLPLVVSVAPRDPERHLRRTLALLREAEVPEASVLVAGADAKGVSLVRGCGFRVTLGALSAVEAAELIAREGPDGLLLSSDLGGGRSDPLVPARATAALEAAGLSRAVIRRVAFENAAAFYDVAPGAPSAV